jgi:hypothetical protein
MTDDLVERLKLEAQIHAQEARTANATIAEIYRAVTNGTGEPGNWHGAAPVVAELARLRTKVQRLEADARRLDWLESWREGDVTICPPGEHGGDMNHWLVGLDSRTRPSGARSYRWGEERTAPTLRDAIDAIRAAIDPTPNDSAERP